MALELRNYDPALQYGANLGVAVDLTDITDMNGNEVIEIDGTTSAVNYVRVTNSATGNAPALSAQGDDTNISIALIGKGTGAVGLGQATSVGVILLADQPILDSASNEEIKFVKTSSAVNELTVTNAATGNPPTLSATGDDTNINLGLAAKGTGLIKLGQSGTGTTSSGAVTVSTQVGVITTEALTTAAGAAYTITWTNTKISTASVILCTLGAGTNSQGTPVVFVTPGSGSATVVIANQHASAAFNGTLKLHFCVL